MRLASLVFLSMLVFGCSNRSIYEGIQFSNKQACAELPPADYEDCMAETSQSYDDYQRDLKELEDSSS